MKLKVRPSQPRVALRHYSRAYVFRLRCLPEGKYTVARQTGPEIQTPDGPHCPVQVIAERLPHPWARRLAHAVNRGLLN